MINPVAIQRLLEAAIMLKLERGQQVADGRAATAQSSNQNALAPQQTLAGRQQPNIQNQRIGLNRLWTNAPILPPDNSAGLPLGAAVAQSRETIIAPLAYRESIAEAGQIARSADPSAPLAAPIPAPIQYANAELAHAVSAKAPRSIFGFAATAAHLTPTASPVSTETEQPNKRRNIVAGAIISGAIVLFAVLASALLV